MAGTAASNPVESGGVEDAGKGSIGASLRSRSRRDMMELIRTNSMDPDFRALVILLDKELRIRDGEDLRILSRSGDAHAASAHDCDLITQHVVTDFRSLVY